MKRFKKIREKLLITGLLLSVNAVYGAANIPPEKLLPQDNAGVILNQSKNFFEQQRIHKEIEEGKTKNMEEIQHEAAEKLEESSKSELHFKLNGVKFSPSEVLTAEELKNISDPYVSKEITVNDLYKMVNAVNELYSEKGYVVCRAGLPPQTISNGYVEIILIEGKTGKINIEGNKSTKEKYIKDRVKLESGEVSNLNELNDSLIWFNGTNDIQMRIEMEAGELPGTTDYILNVYEPEKHQGSVFIDNSGSETSGEFRGGLSYINSSLFGYRDQLSLTAMGSDGTVSGSFGYSVPINKKGTRMQLQYSASTVEIIDGPLKDVGVEGESSSYGVTFIHPLVVNSKRKMELSVGYSNQTSSTDFMGIPWVDDTITKFTAGLSVTTYGESTLWYTQHNISKGTWESLTSENKDYMKYDMMFMLQKMFRKNNMLTFKFNGQYAFDDYLPSADQFYAGGSYSVRGYTESFMGADSGVTMSAEYSFPAWKKGELFVFLDGGALYGENAFDENMIYSTGIGYRVLAKNKLSISATVGIPLNKNFEDEGMEVDSSRVHLIASYLF